MVACAAGLSAAAQPSYSRYNTTCCNPGDAFVVENLDIDFSKSSTFAPSRNFPTWTSPTSTGVKYFDINELKDDASGCYEVSSSGTSADDAIIFYKNTAGTWVTLSDDDGGNHQFRARYAAINHEDHFLRISPYSSTLSGFNNNNTGIVFTIQRINADPYNTNTSDANSCRVANIPYYRRGFNSDLPYTAP